MFTGLLMEYVRIMLAGSLLATTFIVVFSGAYYGARARRIRTKTPRRTRRRRRSVTGGRSE
jgi:hypothetical protein